MKSVTVIIPTLNGEPYLREVLTAVEAQDYPGDVEVLAIDSGSTDGTLDILADFPHIRVEHIDKASFGHGRTRNWGAHIATGYYVAFLTQDATPAGSTWLSRLVEPLEISDDVWGVFGAQVPRRHCPPLQKYEILGAFGASGTGIGVTVQSDKWAPTDARDQAAFYSDVNAATRRVILTELLPYRDVPYGEDQFFGRDVLAAGKLKAYAPRAAVIHSNDISLRDYARRIFDEGLALRGIGSAPEAGALPRRVTHVLKGVLGDSLRILRDADYSWGDKFRWWCINPGYHWQKWRGYRWAETIDPHDPTAVARHSLELGGSTSSP
jgi:rhamnosyltransferase